MLLSPAYAFPPVPTSPAEFVAHNLTLRPTFFGCETTSANKSMPLVIYLANGSPPHNGETPLTNTSTLQLEYDTPTVHAMLDRIFTIATQGSPPNSNRATNPVRAACLACAVMDQERARRGVGCARAALRDIVSPPVRSAFRRSRWLQIQVEFDNDHHG